MTDLGTSSLSDFMPILIRHEQAPINYLLAQERTTDNEADLSVIHCQIFSNAHFYTAFLNELSSSSHFADLFSQILTRLNNKIALKTDQNRLQHLFSTIRRRRPNQFYLQVHPYINQYDAWINRLWTSIQLHALIKRIRYESSWAWLSTLGGGHSCLGEENVRHAKEAEEISKNQIGLATEIGDPNAIVKSYLFLSLSYLQQKRYDEVRTILRFQHRRIQERDITEDRLPVMCIALWKKMKYAIKQDKKENF